MPRALEKNTNWLGLKRALLWVFRTQSWNILLEKWYILVEQAFQFWHQLHTNTSVYKDLKEAVYICGAAQVALVVKNLPSNAGDSRTNVNTQLWHTDIFDRIIFVNWHNKMVMLASILHIANNTRICFKQAMRNLHAYVKIPE